MPIYNGLQKVSFPGIDKIYVGSNLVYQKLKYTKLSYIESTSNTKGSFNIQTDIPINTTDTVVIDYQLTKSTYNQSSGQYYGALISSNNLDTRILYTNNYNGTFVVYWNGSSTQANWGASYFNTNRYTVEIGPSGTNRVQAKINNSSYYYISDTNPANIEKFSVFSQTYNGDQPSILAKLYRITITNSSNVVIHDLIPALNESNIPGLWDIITNKFYPNNGSGTFSYEVSYEGDLYRALEYIHFNGAEYVPIANSTYTSGDEFTLKFSIDDNTITRQDLGDIYVPSASYNNEWSIGSLFAERGIQINCGGWSDVEQFPLETYMPNNTIRIIKTKAGASSFKPYMIWTLYDNNNTQLATMTKTSTRTAGLTGGPLWLMCLKMYSSSSSSPLFYTKGRVYEAYYDDGHSDHDADFYYKPCQRKSDLVCGLYDTIHQVFYPMIGTTITNAAAGPVINENPGWN